MTTRGRSSPSDWDAAAYHRVSNPRVEWAEGLLSDLTLTGAERVLEAGCGTGRVLALLAGRVPSGAAIGLDRSSRMRSIGYMITIGCFATCGARCDRAAA